MAKAPNVKYKGDRTLHDMGAYFRSVNWRDYWEEFYLSRNPDGSYKYRNVFDFARVKAKSEDQRHFIIWYCGADIFNDEESARMYSFVGLRQGNWRQKRQSGDWYREEQAKTTEALTKFQSNAYESIKQAGNKVALPLVIMFSQLPSQILDAFGGLLALPDVTADSNIARMKAIEGLLNESLSMIDKIFSLYAKTQGLSFEDAQTSMQIVMASIQGSQNLATEEKSRVHTIMEKFISDSFVRAHDYDLPIPEEMKRAAVEITTQANEKKKVH